LCEKRPTCQKWPTSWVKGACFGTSICCTLKISKRDLNCASKEAYISKKLTFCVEGACLCMSICCALKISKRGLNCVSKEAYISKKTNVRGVRLFCVNLLHAQHAKSQKRPQLCVKRGLCLVLKQAYIRVVSHKMYLDSGCQTRLILMSHINMG